MLSLRHRRILTEGDDDGYSEEREGFMNRILSAVGLILLAGVGVWPAPSCKPTEQPPDDRRAGRSNDDDDDDDDDCASDEHLVGEECVPDVFSDGDFPPPDLTAIETDVSGQRYIGNSLLVLARASTTSAEAEATFTELGGQISGGFPGLGIYLVRFDDAVTTELLDAQALLLAAEPTIAGASRDAVLDGLPTSRPPADLETVAASVTWNDYNPPNLGVAVVGQNGTWAYRMMKVPEAWDQIHEENPVMKKVIVGVVDTPVAKSVVFPNLAFTGVHDLRPASSGSDLPSYARHGTAAASIIGAPNDGGGMNGILSGLACVHYDLAPQAVFWAKDPPAQQRDGGDLTTTTDAVVFGLLRAVGTGARVVSLSLGQDFRAESNCKNQTGADFAACAANVAASFENLQGVVRVIASRASRTLFVSSAGNLTADAAVFWPGAVSRPSAENPADNWITVGALNRDGTTAAAYSNVNGSSPGAVSISAPVGGPITADSQEEILATLPDGRLTMFSGTSASTPMVAGVAGLVMAVAPMLNGQEVKSLLLASADTAGVDASVGGRRVNAQAAVNAALQEVFLRAPNRLGDGDCREADDATVPPPDACAAGGNVFECACGGTTTVNSASCAALCADVDPGLSGFCHTDTCGAGGCGLSLCDCFCDGDPANAAASLAYCQTHCTDPAFPVPSCIGFLDGFHPSGCDCHAP